MSFSGRLVSEWFAARGGGREKIGGGAGRARRATSASPAARLPLRARDQRGCAEKFIQTLKEQVLTQVSGRNRVRGTPRYPDLRSNPRRSRLPVETPRRRAAVRLSGCRRGGAAAPAVAPAVTASLTCSTAELTCSTVSLTCSTVRRVCSPSVFASRWSLWISRWSSRTSSLSSLSSATRSASSCWILRRSLASRTLRTARYMSGSTESTLKVPLMRTKVSRAVITNPSERARSEELA